MGSPKPLLSLGDRPMLLHVLDALDSVEAISRIIIISGPAHAALQPIVPASVELIHNSDYAAGGMISSVQRGLAVLDPSCGAAIIALGDQPLVRHATIVALIDAWRASRPRIVLPRHQQRRGHPVLIDAAGFDEIRSLSTHQTLQTYTSRHARATMQIDVDDPAILFDVDTPDDYQQAQALLIARSAQRAGRRT
jgi:molybdenum cofactor cytidylyltransferase